jgi:tetratricopeptide (TPR) repeat protein
MPCFCKETGEMPNSKRSSIQRRSPAGLGDPRQSGLRAFHANRFNEAILTWAPLAERDVQVRAALAEAYFRRALAGAPSDTAVADLRRAVELEPDDLRFHFHLGRYLHLCGALGSAAREYRAVLEGDPNWAGAAQLLALATLEQSPQADLAALPGFSPKVAHRLAPAQTLLNGSSVPPDDDSPVGRLWRGLGLVAAGDAAAGEALGDDRPLPNATLTALRRYYRGVAAAGAGDAETALKLWRRVYDSGVIPARLPENMAVLLFEQLSTLVETGDVASAAALAERSAGLPGSTAFDELRLLALDCGAQAAAGSGEWARAAELWETARQVLASSANLGSPRPLLHNLALAYERQELWEQAAESWRAMLRTRSRRKGASRSTDDEAGLSDQQWAWVRERIISDYKQAGRPDEAVVVFRQIIKEDPNDLDTRVQLADALLANEQERAAYNEIERILKIDPQHVEALLRQIGFFDVNGQLGGSEQIMRDLAARHPEREDLRQRAAQLFLEHGRQYAEWGQADRADKAFVEGEQYDPASYLFPLNQARMRIGRRPHDEIRALIERATALAGDQVSAYSKIFETWVIADQMDEARALLERIESQLKPDAHVYANLGLTIIMRVTPPPAPVGLFGWLGTLPPATPKPADTPWTQLAAELLDRAVEMRPDDLALHREIASALMLPRADMACRYAEAAARLAPDDPDILILLGLVQGLDEQVREAKATLQRAAQLARKQGKRDLAQQAQEMRRTVGTPMLRAGIQMSMMQAELGGLDEDFDLDDIEDFF